MTRAEVSGEYDVVVVGSGGGALTGAALAAGAGLSVVVLERTSLIGGTSAYSGGACWLPGTDVQQRTGLPDSTEGARSYLAAVLQDPDQEKVGRRFSNGVMELLLAAYGGAFTTTPPSSPSEYGVYAPAFVDAAEVEHAVVLPSGERVVVPHAEPAAIDPIPAPAVPAWVGDGPTRSAPLGLVVGGRSGDKGGNANVCLWCRDDRAYAWLAATLDVELFRSLVPEAVDLPVTRYELPNLRALNFVVEGTLGDGVASSVRADPQAKGLAELVRSRLLPIPESLLPH